MITITGPEKYHRNKNRDISITDCGGKMRQKSKKSSAWQRMLTPCSIQQAISEAYIASYQK
jgi:hypothetical protein